jgi:transposase
MASPLFFNSLAGYFSLKLFFGIHLLKPTMTRKSSAEKTVRNIRRATRKRYSSEEKIRIVLGGLRGEESVAELCRKEGINANIYYRWSKDVLEAGKKRLSGDTVREATSDEVNDLRRQSAELKETLAEVVMENRVLKKSVLGIGEDGI